jgi:mRNA interferase RelE/StbE
VSQAEEIYSLEFDAVFFKLDERLQERIEAKIEEVGARLDDYPHHRLKGSERFRLRVGDYHVIYRFDPQQNIIYLIALGHRREIYK